MDTLLPQRPGSYLTLIERSLKLYNASFNYIYLNSLIVAFLIFIPRILIDATGNNFLAAPFFSLQRLALILLNLMWFMFLIAIFWRLHCVIVRRHEPFIEDLQQGIRKSIYALFATIFEWIMILGVNIIVVWIAKVLYQNNFLFNDRPISFLLTFAVFTGQVFLILYTGTLFIFLLPLIGVENKGIVSALRKSAYLVWNHWWRVFSTQITPWICLMVAIYTFRSLFNINLYFSASGHPHHPLWAALVEVLIFSLFIPWMTSLMMVQLRDLELRKAELMPAYAASGKNVS